MKPNNIIFQPRGFAGRKQRCLTGLIEQMIRFGIESVRAVEHSQTTNSKCIAGFQECRRFHTVEYVGLPDPLTKRCGVSVDTEYVLRKIAVASRNEPVNAGQTHVQ